jgi:hypothetical protein
VEGGVTITDAFNTFQGIIASYATNTQLMEAAARIKSNFTARGHLTGPFQRAIS